jgi:hypothetical protein
MKPMDHAEAHERIADLALEPGRLTGLAGSEAAEDVALRRHVAECSRCQHQLAEWHDFHAALNDAVTANRREQLEPIAPPAELRQKVLAGARAEPRSAVTASAADVIPLNLRRRRPPVPGGALLALAAVVALVAVGLGTLVARDQASRLDATLMESRWLSDTVSALSRVLAAPDHHSVTLFAADGTGRGSIAWSRHDLVVLASPLAAPASSEVYRCWLDYEGTETAMGKMWFVDGNAFWVGSTGDWAAIDLDPEKQFLVTLEPTTNTGDTHQGPIVLQANLGG